MTVLTRAFGRDISPSQVQKNQTEAHSNGPSRLELTVLWIASGVLFLSVILLVTPFMPFVSGYGDNFYYAKAASAIRTWNFDGIAVIQFWGTSYFAALISLISGVPELTALLILSWAASITSVLLARKLWNGWVAGYFAVLSFAWIQRSFLGGSEPLFLALLFGALLLARREWWVLASLVAAVATVTRPLGILCLAAIGIVLLMRQEYKKLAVCTGLSLGVAILYLLPIWLYLPSPFFQIQGYRTSVWDSSWIVGLPFVAILNGMLSGTATWRLVVTSSVWMAFTLIGEVAIARKVFRRDSGEHRQEWLFAFLYIVFLFTFNTSRWAFPEFYRFAVPAVPFIVAALSKWIPKSRLLLYGIAAVSAVFGACWVLRIHNFSTFLPLR